MAEGVFSGTRIFVPGNDNVPIRKAGNDLFLEVAFRVLALDLDFSFALRPRLLGEQLAFVPPLHLCHTL